MNPPLDTYRILTQAFIASEQVKAKRARAYAIGFLLLLLMVAFAGDFREQITQVIFVLFASALLFSTYKWWYHHSKPYRHPLVKVISDRPDSIVRIYLSNKHWRSTAGTPLGDAQHVVFIDDRGKQYSLRVPSLDGQLLLGEIASLFPRARFGYESK